MSELGGKGWFVVHSRTTSAIKLAMAAWYLGMVAPISSILGLFNKNVLHGSVITK